MAFGVFLHRRECICLSASLTGRLLTWYLFNATVQELPLSSIWHFELDVLVLTYITSYDKDLTVQHQKVYINFSHYPNLNMKGQMVHLPLIKLVLGLANGWANGNKTLYGPSGCWQGLQESCSTRTFSTRLHVLDHWQERKNDIHMPNALNQVLCIQQQGHRTRLYLHKEQKVMETK